MPILENPYIQIAEGLMTIYLRKGERMAVRPEEDFHADLMRDLGLDPDAEVPDDPGMVNRDRDLLTWVGYSSQYGSPSSAEHKITLQLVKTLYPNFRHRLA